MKFDRFYSRKENKEFYLLILESKKEKFKDDIFCNQCLKAELYSRKGIKQLHLAKKPSSDHEEWCIHHNELIEVDNNDMGYIKLNNIKKTLWNLASIKKLNYLDKKRKLALLNKELVFEFGGIRKKLIPRELDENYTQLLKKDNDISLYFGEVFLTKAPVRDKFCDVYTIKTLNKVYIMGLYINKSINDIDLYSEKEIFFICKGKIKMNYLPNKTYLNVLIEKREDYEILVLE